MTRGSAAKLTREELDKHGLKDWHVRLNPTDLDRKFQFLGLCSYKDKCIILNAHHIDIHSDPDIINTIRHEIAHAIVGPFNGHNEVWAAKAKEVGCDNTAPCSTLQLTPTIIDAIRSGATIEVTYEEEIIRRPKYQVTRLQDRCEVCNKVAVSKNEILDPNPDPFKPDRKLIWLECGHMVVKQIPKGTSFHLLIADADPNCKHKWTKTICNHCGAKRPYEFQIEGMLFGEQAIAVNNGVLIMDEMGLGKTPQALGILKYHPELWPFVLVVKSGIRFQMFKETLRWCGDDFYCQIIQSSKDVFIKNLKGYIISYDVMVPKVRKLKSGKLATQGFDITKFDAAGIKTIVLDECQQIKSPDSTRTQQIRKIAKGRKVIGLSGTPWKNRGSEFFSILNMIAPMKFSSYQGYKDKWVQTYYDGRYTKEGGIKHPERFKEYIKDIAIRRERIEVMKDLPLISRNKFNFQLDSLRQEEYDESESKFADWLNNAIIGGEEPTGMAIIAEMARMRRVNALAKIPATKEFVAEFIEETDRKIVVFVHHKDVGQYLFEHFQQKYSQTIPVLKITSDMSGEDRFTAQEKFNNSERAILVASTLAAGEGLNLQTCSDCVMHERQWNPANEEQAEGRFIRIGQKATTVTATYIEAEGTIDVDLDAIVERKRRYFHEGMNKGEMPVWNSGDLVKELADAVLKRVQSKKRKKVS
jgi:SNF2 family DNA or RNA helicase